MGGFDDSLLRFNITLKRLSMNALIANTYEHPDIKKKMKEVIQTQYLGHQYLFPMKSMKKEIIKLASQKIMASDLPKSLMSDVQGLLIFFAKKIASWAEYIVKISKMDMSCLDKIYWTSLGLIDVAKIFHENWKKNKNFLGDSDKVLLLMTAIRYANKDIILSHQNEMIKEIQKGLKRVRLPNIKDQIDQIMATYTCHMYGESYDMCHRTEIYQKFKETGKVNIREIIFMCDGQANTIKYLWNSLSDDEKDSIVVRLAYDNMKKGLSSGNYNFGSDGPDTSEIEMFGIAGHAEVVFFLLSQMSLEQRNAFFMKTAKIRDWLSTTGFDSIKNFEKKNDCDYKLLELFLRVWPYPELCLKMLNNEWICEIIKQERPSVILYKLLSRMVHDLTDLAFVTGICSYPNVFYELLKKIMSLVSKNAKELIFFKPAECERAGIKYPRAIENFYHIFALNAICIIINDKDLRHKRELIISMASEKITKLLSKGNLKSVISFMEKVLVSNEERKTFIKIWNIDNHVVVANNTDIREKIFNWLRA